MALIVMSALTISIGALISFTTGNEAQFSRDRESARAFHVAEAGVNNALSVLENADDKDFQGAGTILGPYNFSLDGADGTYSMTKYAKADTECTHLGSPSNCWVITGTATSPNGKITRTIQETTYWKNATTPLDALSHYGLVVDNQGSACVDTHGTAPMTIKDVWISGDFCPSGDVSLNPPAAHTGSIYIGGVYMGKNNASIGTSALPYASADIVGGCTNQGSPEICSDSASSNVYSDNPPSVDPSSFSLPSINPTQTYQSGNWSTPTCSGGSFTFDSNSVQDGTTPTTTLMPSGGNFDCTVYDDNGDVVGHLAWNSATKQLSISGTVWIDGDVDLSNSGTYVKDNVVTGANGGTIFINGTVSGSSNITVCGPAGSPVASGSGCPTTWDPNQGILGMVVVNPKNITKQPAFDRTGNGELDIMLLVNQGYANTGGTTVMGPVMADTATIGGNGGSIVPVAPPTSFPSSITTQATWVVQPGSWKQIQ
ncbi:MAG TPA: hypothetical protein VFI04_08275 [Gaiellaceae bacterium]|nr:hypothetical protein [Gaiellaceae bacterium]